MIKIGINGYGRIGRNILRAVYEQGLQDEFKVVAVNDLTSPEINVHLTKYDSIHGPFNRDVQLSGEVMTVEGDDVQLFAEPNPELIPWSDFGVDVVFECTGRFRSRDTAGQHLGGSVKKVVVSAPGSGVDATVVYGVNDDILDSSHEIISNASCTTNCLAPVAKVLHEEIGIESGYMTTIHAYTNDQVLLDAPHSDIYRARSATLSMIPTKTGAAAAVGLVLPELQGKLDGGAIRVPTVNVSLVDLTMIMDRETSVEEVNGLIETAAAGPLQGVLQYVTEPLVSIDFNHSPYSSNFDAAQTRVNGKLVKLMTWYDNEWGFSCRMLDTTRKLMSV
ncbi:MAG: type I glyceraldehyde-3-phosphate dehydrogenase [Gammaproteobacteria bacterium]